MKKTIIGTLSAVTLLLAGFGIAHASIPAPDGTINGCYKNDHPAEGALVVVDSGASCPSGYTALNWRSAQGSVAAPTAWESLSVEAGWTVVTSYGALRVRREGDLIRLTGVVNGAEGAGSVITVLPPQYRPSGVKRLSGAMRTFPTDSLIVDVQPGGQVTAFGPLPASFTLSGTFVLN